MTMRPRVSVVIPTYQRRDIVLRLIDALGRLDFAGSFETVVVVDGSTDGTHVALASRSTTFPLRIVMQDNQGLSKARNRGAAEAWGEILLFLDDDMEPDPRLLTEHDRSHREGGQVVSGAIPLHPESPSNLLASGVGHWADGLNRRLSEPGHVPRFYEIINGQFSVQRDVFFQLGGFDERFTRAGSYGNEDLDFGYRLIAGEYRAVYNPNAISFQRYVVDAASHLRQYRQAGHADVTMARKYPQLLGQIFTGELSESRMHRLARMPVLRFPRFMEWLAMPLERVAVHRVGEGRQDAFTSRAFFLARAIHYWLGVHEAGGIPLYTSLRVLAYHAVADLADDPVLADYGVPSDRFRAQLRTLLGAGYRFVEPDEVLRLLTTGAGLPRRALLLTFDDCYSDLVDAALPILQEEGIPALAFAVSGRLGKVNDWDVAIGAKPLPLLAAEDLIHLSKQGVEIGSHSVTHRMLPRLSNEELKTEISGSATTLAEAGLPKPRLLSYPHGEHDARVRAEAARAGYAAAFTVTPGVLERSADRMTLPRIEIFREDLGWRLRVKVALAGRHLSLWSPVRSLAGQLMRRARNRRIGHRIVETPEMPVRES